jgi:hypothetical protein
VSRFPRFFQDAAHLPPEVDAPHELSPGEEAVFAGLDDWSGSESRYAEESRIGPNDRFGPPHWLFPETADDAGDPVFDVSVPTLEELAVGEPRPGEEIPDLPSGVFGTSDLPDIDAVAFYAPWHFYGEEWGIYFTPGFADFLNDIAHYAGQPPSAVEPFVVYQVLAHELTHFEFEVVATELEATLERSLYREYMLLRFALPTRWAASPLEESVATWEEVRFARRRSPPRPKGFSRAVRLIADHSPPGYRDWRVMNDDRRGSLVTATLAGLIAGQPLLEWPWGDTSTQERGQVPVRWRGDPKWAPSFFAPKSVGRPSPKDLERFLRKNGAELDPKGGKGSHRKFRWRGKIGGYATSRPAVPKAESQQIARIFGFSQVSELYRAIAEARVIG